MNITGIEEISNIIEDILNKEIQSENGLLTDVETFIRITEEDTLINTPMIWMVQNKVEPADVQAGISHKLFLQCQFEFVCLYDDLDPVTAEQKAVNLASRVMASLDKNMARIRSKNLIYRYDFVELYPPGLVTVTNKQESIPASSVIINVIFPVDWKNCTLYTKRRVFVSVPSVQGETGDTITLNSTVTEENGEAVPFGRVDYEIDDTDTE